MLDWLFVVSLFFHLLATVVWIGGLVLMTVLVWPEARNALAQGTNPALMAYLDRLRNRFNPLATLSLIVLIVTGLYQMARSPNYEGMLRFNNTWSRAILVKHIAVIGMIIAGAFMQWSVIPAIERATLFLNKGKQAPNLPDIEKLRRRERQLVALNCVLGVLVLVFTAIATSV